MHRARYEERTQSFFRDLSKGAILPTLSCVHHPRSCPNPVLLGQCGGFITLSRLSKPLAIGNGFNLQPLSSPWSLRGGIESSNPSITGLVLLYQPASRLQMLSKDLLTYISSGVVERGLFWISRHLYHYYHLGKSEGFRSSQCIFRSSRDKDQMHVSY